MINFRRELIRIEAALDAIKDEHIREDVQKSLDNLKELHLSSDKEASASIEIKVTSEEDGSTAVSGRCKGELNEIILLLVSSAFDIPPFKNAIFASNKMLELADEKNIKTIKGLNDLLS